MAAPSYVPDAPQQVMRRIKHTRLTQNIPNSTKDDMWKFMEFEPHELQRMVAYNNMRHKILCCGRRWGKSKLAASEALIAAALGGWVWVVAPSYDLATIIFEEAGNIAESSDFSALLDGQIRYAPGKQRIKTVTGGRIYAKSSEKPTSLLGYGLDLLIFDEASKEKNSMVYPQYLSPTLSDREGGSLIISTPTGNDWFKDRWLQGQEGYKDPVTASWQFESRSSPYFPESEWDYQKANLPERVFDQEYRAVFLDDAGGVFRGFRDCVFEGEMTGTNSGNYVIGLDLAKWQDWTVIVVMCASTRKVVWMDRFNKIDWPFQKKRVQLASERWSDAPVLVDSSGIGDPILSDLREMGVEAYGYKFSNISKNQLINQLALAFEQQEISIPNDTVLLEEIASYQYERTPAGNLTMNAPSGKHDDTVIALALAVEMCTRNGGTGLPALVYDPRRVPDA